MFRERRKIASAHGWETELSTAALVDSGFNLLKETGMNGANPRSTASIAGHPIHPMIIPFPIAFLTSALVTDLAFWSTRRPMWAEASLWLIGAGIVMALAAAIFGFADFFGERRIRDLSDAWQHMIGN